MDNEKKDIQVPGKTEAELSRDILQLKNQLAQSLQEWSKFTRGLNRQNRDNQQSKKQ